MYKWSNVENHEWTYNRMKCRMHAEINYPLVYWPYKRIYKYFWSECLLAQNLGLLRPRLLDGALAGRGYDGACRRKGLCAHFNLALAYFHLHWYK